MLSKAMAALTLVIIGIILADVIAHPAGAKAFFNGVGGLWRTSVNGLLGKAS